MQLVRHRHAISVTDHTKLWYKVRCQIAKSSAQAINCVGYSMCGIVQNGGPSDDSYLRARSIYIAYIHSVEWGLGCNSLQRAISDPRKHAHTILPEFH